MSAFSNVVPKCIFIIPYRNRPQHKFFFSTYMTSIFTNSTDYEIYFSHQCDERTFNRGATKNIGFLAMKRKYPNDYKNITFVFNDIDTVPFANIFNYDTVPGTVKHFYGFHYALGGIVAISGEDFEKINGYPNFWGWGMEDSVLQTRCEKAGISIDRSHFFPIGSPEILHLFDGVSRIISKRDPLRAKNDNGLDGIKSINRLVYTVDITSNNVKDNIYTCANDKLFIINITNFLTATNFTSDEYHDYDLRDPASKIVNPTNERTTKLVATTDDWTNIPYYPTVDERKDMVKKYIANNHKPQQQTQQMQRQRQPQNASFHPEKSFHSEKSFHPVNVYAPNYANKIGVKPRATSSANIRMGGVKF